MQSEKYSKVGLFLIAMALALDQRIEFQATVLVVLFAFEFAHGLAPREMRKAAILLTLVVVYMVINSLMMVVAGGNSGENWWAAPVRIFLYYILFIMLSLVLEENNRKDEMAFFVLEWLFWIKAILIIFEGVQFISTGAFSEKPLFNLVVAPDSLLGVRFTSSYDILFSLLVFSPRRQVYRFMMVVMANLLCETRLVFLMTILFLLWRFVQGRMGIKTIFVGIVTLMIAIGAATRVAEVGGTSSRLTEVSGSSVDDKMEQIIAVKDQLLLPCVVAGCGLGSSLTGIIRDESRPYSYEAQVPVLLMQGGILFFVTHLFFIAQYIRRRRVAATFIVVLASVTNPLLFSLSSAFFLLTFGYVCDPERQRN